MWADSTARRFSRQSQKRSLPQQHQHLEASLPTSTAAAQPNSETPSIGDNLAVALEYIAAGIPVFPCRVSGELDPHTGRVYGPKSPLTSNGLYGASTNEKIVRQWWRRNPDALVGIPTGEKTGFFALDVDVKEGKHGDVSLAALEAEHAPLPPTVVVQTATGGTHFLFKHVDGLTTSTGSLPADIDIRAQGGYVIAAGSTLADGTFYEFLGGHTTSGFMAEVAEAPKWLVDIVRSPRRPLRHDYTPANDNAPAGAAEVEELLSFISPDIGYQDWVNVLMAVHGALGGDGFAIADAWSARGAKYRKGDVAARWKGFTAGKGVTLSTVAQLARDGGADLSAIATKHRGRQHDVTQKMDPEKVEAFVAKELAKKTPVAANDNDPVPAEPRALSIFEWTVDRFKGEAPAVQYLVDGVIPLGVPGMVSAAGDTGKSFALLELHRRVAFGSGGPFATPIFGGQVVGEGTSVMITSEDDANEVHRRIDALDTKGNRYTPAGKRMIVVPLPSAGGARAFWKEDKKQGLIETDDFKRICDQLKDIGDLRLVTFDPLASFAHLPLNEDPSAGQFVCTSLSRLATETGATILTAHHMRKSKAPIETLADAREAIRGSTALVDGLRLAYAMWPADEARAKRTCKSLGIQYQPNRIVLGGVVKANGAARRIMSTYARSDSGLLVDKTAGLGTSAPAQDDLRTALVVAVEAAANAGSPFTKTGASGLFEMRERLPEELRRIAKGRLDALATEALERGEIVRAAARGEKTAKWLDVPGGIFAIGLGNFTTGTPR
ncbi:AAA family ATPase [Sinorhizobium meliloti]|uniref:AAA family ATPase n=1 Tax=Rhizobium meliloti TaxID=382 RepID=A0A6A7ZUI1_RHIML|nr:AAA family ATPase [Sinorhizobium meliloti]MDW9495398.1 AAA family ATPase [Sinorhizobium meliloti]MDW9563753.1 AAA family ATPase [Sinorhizobium meliloti]MDW9651113.1 AAA family ATPase [Sinorhizobium meliloti]MDW9861637.1 AAA family ATPase [Sinorhizobium meliloti]